MLQAQTYQFNIPLFVSIGCAIILFFVFFFYLLIIQSHKRSIIHQKEMFDLKTQYEQTILQSQIEIQEQTFRNISQEIHDNIGQVLSLAKLNLNTIHPDTFTQKISLTEELLGKAINDLRDLSRSLHTEKIADIGLTDAIRHELALIEKTTQIHTSLSCENSDFQLSQEKTIIAFRMIQEVLHNILKHSKATEVNVLLECKEDQCSILVKDNGKGFDLKGLKKTDSGIGLKSIQQRCKFIDAVCNIETAPGNGTIIQIIISKNIKELV